MATRSDVLARIQSRVRSAAAHVGFFRLVRLLEAEFDVELGAAVTADEEPIRFAHSATNSRAAADVLRLDTDDDEVAVTITTSFFGLLGTESPLAPSYTEQVHADDAGGLASFFGVFEHRALTLLYAAWKRYAHTAGYRAAGTDRVSRALLSLVGVDAFSPIVEEETAVDRMVVLGLSDLAGCDLAYLDLSGFENVLRRLFPDLDLRVSWSTPRFVTTDPVERTRLGEHQMTLGVDFAYGYGALDSTGVVRIKTRLVDAATCEALMPGGARYRVMQPVVDEWLASRAMAELEVTMAGEEAPHFQLGMTTGSRLGIDSRYTSATPKAVRVRAPLVAHGSIAEREYVDDV